MVMTMLTIVTVTLTTPSFLLSCAGPESVPVVLLIFSAGPVNITFADEDPRVAAIMQCFFPAQAAGDALLHVLLNDVPGAVPAGRLPYTWPMWATQVRNNYLPIPSTHTN